MCHDPPQNARKVRAFVVSPYFPDDQGKLRTEIPLAGPCQEWDARPCVLGRHDNRPRKTGPCFPLVVVVCRTHHLGFTLYPPGHVPYGRQVLAPMAPDGSALAAGKAGADAFSDTFFKVALDGAKGQAWPRECEDGRTALRFSTQARRLTRAGLLLGIEPELVNTQRETIAHILSVPGQVLHEGHLAIQADPGYVSRSTALCAVLDALPARRYGYLQLAESGHYADLWPAVYLWQDNRLRRAFPNCGIRAPPSANAC